MATVYDAIKRASAQQYSGEAQTDELEDEELLSLYIGYANEGFRRIWRKMDPIEEVSQKAPKIIRLPCPTLERDTSLDIYDARVYDALSDYMTWRMLGTGNANKQQRGEWYRARFEETLGRIPRDASWDTYDALYGGNFVGVWDW